MFLCSIFKLTNFYKHVHVHERVHLCNSESSHGLNSNLGTSFTVLASQRVTSRSDLLVALETHYNISIVERNFAHLSGRNRHFADVILDECSAIVVEPMTSLKVSCGNATDTLKQKLAVLSLKYENVWLILENGANSECVRVTLIYTRHHSHNYHHLINVFL